MKSFWFHNIDQHVYLTGQLHAQNAVVAFAMDCNHFVLHNPYVVAVLACLDMPQSCF